MEVRVVGPQSEGYPMGMKDVEGQPDLFVLGDFAASPGVAIVGTRRCTRYGIDLAESMGAAVASAGWTTVSGLARGIDAAAHRGCLGSAGHTVAVLGSGVDVCYPRENTMLYDEILKTGGAVISEYPPGTPPDRWRFPARNRIIAAISSAVVVVEAAKKGGALITARLAAEIGRPVFVVPGDVDRPASKGCNLLIRDGAYPVFGSSDLIEELSLILGPPQEAPSGTIDQKGFDIEELAEHWRIPVSEAVVRLGRLELKGEVQRKGDRVILG